MELFLFIHGSGNYVKDAPPGSFVNARDFESASHLMQFLTHVHENHDLYSEYFAWKREYSVELGNNRAYCELCEALSNYKNGIKVVINNTKFEKLVATSTIFEYS